MNKSDLVSALADRTGMTKTEASKVVEAIFDPESGIISGALRTDSKVQISGFGAFESRHRRARTGRNPRTGQTITIAASRRPAFRPGKGLKQALN